ncbi:hypothetical protein YC2023_106923 [Brassica napus]
MHQSPYSPTKILDKMTSLSDLTLESNFTNDISFIQIPNRKADKSNQTVPDS